MIEIKNIYGDVIYVAPNAETVKSAVEDAVKNRASLDGARLDGARLDGASLDGASLDGASLDRASLDRASLDRASLFGASLVGASLDGASLVGASLDGAGLDDASLVGASLVGASLDDASLVGARGLPANFDAGAPVDRSKPLAQRQAERAARYRARNPDVPVIEGLDAKILQLIDSGKGHLEMNTWHRCETTHCRAGWAITLAGAKGLELETKYGPHAAGCMIYRASTGRVPNFYASNEAAIADIRAQAEMQS